MSRNGSGVYSLPAGTAAVTSETISSTKFNTLTEDLEADANEVRPIVAGGTGAASASAARTNLGLAPIEPLLTDPGADRITFWDDSESAFGYLTLGTGLSITTTVLSLDADLSTLAGLTVAADNFIAGNAGGTAWEVKTPSQARTSLGLVIGTSGATIPLLDGTNTWSATQTIENTQPFLKFNETGVTADNGLWRFNANGEAFYLQTVNDAQSSAANALSIQRTGVTVDSIALAATAVTINGSTAWHAGNDGAGSGLDADTLDGVQASALAALSGATFTGGVSLTGSSPTLSLSNNTTPTLELDRPAGASYRIRNDGGTLKFFGGSPGAANATTELGRFSSAGEFQATSIQARLSISSESSGTLSTVSANKLVFAAGGITLPNSVFSAGDMIVIEANGSARTITRGAGVTMYVNGANAATATLAANSAMGVIWRTASFCTLTGAVS